MRRWSGRDRTYTKSKKEADFIYYVLNVVHVHLNMGSRTINAKMFFQVNCLENGIIDSCFSMCVSGVTQYSCCSVDFHTPPTIYFGLSPPSPFTPNQNISTSMISHRCGDDFACYLRVLFHIY